MKDLLKNGVLIILTIGILYMIFLRECKTVKCPPKGSVIVSEAFIDSLKKIANRPPKITIKDTIIFRDEIVIVHDSVPVPVEVEPGKKLYQDSTVNDSMRFWNKILVQGYILKWDKWYQPVYKERIITKEITVPYPVKYEVPVPKSGLYLSGLLGGNENSFLYGANIDLINKKDNLYGLQYQRFGNENLYLFKMGFKIKFKRNN